MRDIAVKGQRGKTRRIIGKEIPPAYPRHFVQPVAIAKPVSQLTELFCFSQRQERVSKDPKCDQHDRQPHKEPDQVLSGAAKDTGGLVSVFYFHIVHGLLLLG
jgi:hypothetical protein